MFGKPYKLAFIGTHGTRKTTTLLGVSYHLQKMGISVGQVAEVAREPGFKVNHESTPHDQYAILLTQMMREARLATGEDAVIVCDRSVIDNYIYYQLSVERSGLADPYPWLRQAVHGLADSYDMLVLIKPDIPIEDDNFRSTDVKFQLQVHQSLVSLVQDLWVPKLVEVSASDLGKEEELLKLVYDVAQAVNVRL